MWRCSLVFNFIDKIISVFIYLLFGEKKYLNLFNYIYEKFFYVLFFFDFFRGIRINSVFRSLCSIGCIDLDKEFMKVLY